MERFLVMLKNSYISYKNSIIQLGGKGMKSLNPFTTQEVANLLGISKRTLYRYEKQGIFSKAKRNPINKWREYTSEDIQHLMQIMGR